MSVNHRLTPEEAKVLNEVGIPHVQVGAPTAERIPSVHVDHFRGGFIAGLHLIQQGCTRPVLVLGNFDTQSYCLDIVRGFRSSSKAADEQIQ